MFFLASIVFLEFQLGSVFFDSWLNLAMASAVRRYSHFESLIQLSYSPFELTNSHAELAVQHMC